MKQLFIVVLATLTFAACEKQEQPVMAHESGDVITSSVNMDGNYKYQVFFSLETGKEVSSNIKTVWDLAFDNVNQRLLLNSAKAMFVYNTGKTDFASVTDTAGYSKGYTCDMPSGNPDSTAFGTLNNNVYILDLGRTETGAKLGFKKIKILSAGGNSCSIQYANLDGTDSGIGNILADMEHNRAYFSIINNTQLTIEPVKTSYDLVFTQYTHVFYEPGFYPYLVTGVLLNPSQVAVATENEKIRKFSSITIADTAAYIFKSNVNAIGYSWKDYNIDAAVYTVYPDKIYIIRSINGLYFKLHFIDFYGKEGQKGVPTFEYQQL